MSIRGIWIVSLLPNSIGKVLFSRRFATVDARAKRIHGENFVDTPLDDEFGKSVAMSLGLLGEPTEFQDWRDSAKIQPSLPVLELRVPSGMLWPILVIEQAGFLFCCWPLVEQKYNPADRPHLLQIPSVSVGFSVLLGIMNQLGPTPVLYELGDKIKELNHYLLINVPFGQPSDTETVAITSWTALPNIMSPDSKQKQSVWKPSPHKGKSSFHICICEYVRSVQCDKPGLAPWTEIYGQVMVKKADLEGTQADVSFFLIHADQGQTLHLSSLILHPCVHSSAAHLPSSEGGQSRKFRFTPPSHAITLCHYSVPKNEILPIFGMYKMRPGDKGVEVMLQLRLNDSVQNNFDQCEARIPLFHRGCIHHVDSKPSWGSVSVTDDKHTLVWNIGHKFPAKTREVVLQAKVFFTKDVLPPVPVYEEPFCIGNKAYTQLNFKMSDYTISGCYVDSKNIQFPPGLKVKVTVEREVQASEYKIWNCYGDVPYLVSLGNSDV